jgi:uncharacterized protein (TIGR03435 family)
MISALTCFLVFMQQTVDVTLPQFDVATVRPLELKERNGIDLKIMPGGRVIFRNFRVDQLAAFAWMMPYYRVSGVNDIYKYWYMIEALPPQNDFDAVPKVETLRVQFPEISLLRLRSLLIERFKRQYHFEPKEHIVYDLVGCPRVTFSRSATPYNHGVDSVFLPHSHTTS